MNDLLQCMANQMDSIMVMILELSNKVNDQEKVPEEQMGSPTTSQLKYRTERRRSRWQDSPAQDLDLDEMVRRRVEQRLQQIPILEEPTSYKDSSSEDEPFIKRKKKNIKSCMYGHYFCQEAH